MRRDGGSGQLSGGSRASEVRKLESRPQVVADLRVYVPQTRSCLDVVGAGGYNNLNFFQRNDVLDHGEVPVTMQVRHAEITVLTKRPPGSIPLLLGVSQTVCTPEDQYNDTCRLDIQRSGGDLTTDRQGAIWRNNIATLPLRG